MSGASLVSARLSEPMAPEFYSHVYAPRLRDFGNVFGYLSDINKAHLLMLARQGLVEPAHARALAAAMQRIEREGADSVPLDPRREDAYFNYEAHLIDLVGIEPGGRLHIGRSRNDINATIDRMRARDVVLALGDRLTAVRRAALGVALGHLDTVMPGYTHLQPAQPISYGFYLAAIDAALERDGERLWSAYERIDLCPLGAAALAGTGFAIDRELTAALLGFGRLAPSALDAVASRDFALEVLSALSMLAITWSRAAQDYHVMVTHEFGTVELPDSLAATSSIMPQKKNPVVLEHLRGAAGHMLGYFTATASATKNVNFSNAADINRDGVRSLWVAADEGGRCLELLRLLISRAQPKAELMLARARGDFSTVTDLADGLVRAGLSFREAHHVVGAAVRRALDRGLAADGIGREMLDEAAREQIGRPAGLSAEEIAECLDPRLCMERRTSAGGTAPEAVRATVAAALARLDAAEAAAEARRRHLAEAKARLDREIGELAGA